MNALTWQEIIRDLMPGLPILLLCIIALLIVIVDWFLPVKRSFCMIATACLLMGLLLNLAPTAASRPLGEPIRIFGERLILDRLGLFFTLFFVLTALACVIVSLRTGSLRNRRLGEYYALLMLATVAMSVVIASRDLLVLYLAIETISLPCYVLVGYPRRERVATEAALKYILYGAVASGVMLFGISYVYGITGTTVIASIYDVPIEKAAGLGLALILILAGLGFKMALVPFHSWCPDVYEGAPTPITAYLSVASKGAGIAALLRIVYPLFCATETGHAIPAAIRRIDPWTIFWVLSAATMTFGNLVALWQTNVKRLLAYSSIAHAGYMAMAFSLMNKESFEAIITYLVVYFVMNLGAFFTVLFIENATKRCDLPAYRGLIRRSPLLATVLTIFLLSLLGIPPTAGFMAKFKMFGALIKEAHRPAVILAIVGIINSVISAYYYLKVVKTMVFDTGDDETAIATPLVDGSVVVVFAIAVFALFVFWTPVQNLAGSLPLNIIKF
jgi:NADH-quinone oxidoreductase subunit N